MVPARLPAAAAGGMSRPKPLPLRGLGSRSDQGREADPRDAQRRVSVARNAHNEAAGRKVVHRAACGTLTRVATLRDLARAAGEVLLLAALLLSAPAFAADEDQDLNLIPPARAAGPARRDPRAPHQRDPAQLPGGRLIRDPAARQPGGAVPAADAGKLGGPAVPRRTRRMDARQRRHADLQRPLQPARRQRLAHFPAMKTCSTICARRS